MTQPLVKLLDRLSTLDKAFLLIEEETQLMTIAGAWIFDECPAEDRVVQDLTRWVTMFPVFRARLNGDLWEDFADFDLREHLHVVTLPSPGGKRELEAYMSKVMSTPFDMTRPLWSAHLISGLNGKGAAYFIALHHCISDGQGAIRMTLSLFAGSEEAKIAGAGHTVKPRPKSRSPATAKERHQATIARGFRACGSSGEAVFTFLLNIGVIFLLSVFLAILEWILVRIVAVLAAGINWLVFMISPKKVFNKPTGTRKQVAYSELLDLDEVKQVGRSTGATVNDVLISNLTSTIRKYLESTGELHKEREITCLVPVSVRRPDDWQLGNKVSLVLLNLPIHVSDPVERLKVVKRRLDRVKISRETDIAFLNIKVSLNLIPKFVRDPLLRWFMNKFHILLTNVPGPSEQLVFCGQPVKEYYSFVPQPSKGGLGMCVLSYRGKVSLSLNADVGHITPDTSSLLNEFTREFRQLKAAVEKAHPTPANEEPKSPASPTSPSHPTADPLTEKERPDSGFNSGNSSDAEE